MKKIKISIILNILIVILVTLGTVFMFAGIKFMPSNSLLASNKIEMFKYFTVDSNILVGIVSLILVMCELNLLNNKMITIPKQIYILKLIGTSAVTLTFIVTLLFLTPQYGFYSMYNNSNLFFHLIVPILSIISYSFYEKDNTLKYKEALYGIIPMFLYSIFYISNIFIHLNNGGLTIKYDFYGFLKGNINNTYIVIPVVVLVTYLISLILVTLNKKIKDN